MPSYEVHHLSSPSNPFQGFLFGVNDAPSVEEFLKYWRYFEHYGDFSYHLLNDTQREILNETQRKLFIEFIDNVKVREAAKPDNRNDYNSNRLRVELHSPTLQKWYDNESNNNNNNTVLHRLVAAYKSTTRHSDTFPRLHICCERGSPDSTVIDWRRDWYCDSFMMLNDSSEYEGGRPCFFTPDRGVEVLDELHAGDMIHHIMDKVSNIGPLYSATRLVAGNKYYLVMNYWLATTAIECSPEETEAFLMQLCGSEGSSS